MSFQSTVRRMFALLNDANAVEKTLETGDPEYVTNRIGRRIIYRAANKVAGQMFPPKRRKR